MNTDALLQGRFKDLANKAYQKNIYTFTNFLSASDLDIFLFYPAGHQPCTISDFRWPGRM